MANVEKLEAVLDYIRTHPEEHDQIQWAEKGDTCGTTLCFAGTAAVLAGYQMVWQADDTAYTCSNGIETEYVSTIAMRELGLTEAQTDSLFIRSVTFDDVERTVKDIINESAL
jgi:hypothetical protein